MRLDRGAGSSRQQGFQRGQQPLLHRLDRADRRDQDTALWRLARDRAEAPGPAFVEGLVQRLIAVAGLPALLQAQASLVAGHVEDQGDAWLDVEQGREAVDEGEQCRVAMAEAIALVGQGGVREAV